MILGQCSSQINVIRIAFSHFQLGSRPAPNPNLMVGKGPYSCGSDLVDQCNGKGSFPESILTKDSSYKISLVNMAVSTHFTFWIESHDLCVLSSIDY